MNQCCDIVYQNCNKLDVIQGSYEGGQTLWECTFDLLQYPKQLAGLDVIDMGCGLGLLGIQALKQGAKSVCFQDYNEDTFEQAILPQLKLNNLEENKNYSFVNGDWETLKLQKVDVILASEIIYREEYYPKVEDFIANHLRPDGKCIMINKSYYFGVGGSVAGFKSHLTKLQVVEEETINTKKGVKKTIMKLQLK
ncbi:unnamed protein product [Paramecium octaurelia]|uniref:Uncharacterized protein n=1 Tax=Paramecium octaurelia TaxID=43137 RepID=A0A8S1XLU0_PAROT|nr:unnamed protein product [Paramecium octaurelia]